MNREACYTFFRLLPVMFITAIMTTAYTAAAQADARISNKWRIEFSEGANSDGDIVFRITPSGGPSIEVSTPVSDGTRENRVASQVRDAFKAQLPDGAYHVEKDDGEDVLVKRRGDTPDFSLELISNSVKSVRIHIERE